MTTIVDTIVAGNAPFSGPDVSGTVTTDQGFNLVGDGSGSGGLTAASDQVGTAASPIDAKLAPLGDYGGPTQTMALLSGSPAIGNGVAIPGITTDQRGFALDAPRPDIGAFQSTLVVNTTTDAAFGILSAPGELSLRQAVGLADLLGGTQTITFDPAAFATAQTIALTGQLELSDTSGLLTIDGPAAGLTIDAGGKSDVFQVDRGVTTALSGLTITGGSAVLSGGLVNLGTITLTDCTISGNSAIAFGGVYNDGTATLIDCTISGNSAQYGGGMLNFGTATLTDCTISGNSATRIGGGLWNDGTATITDCTISGNSATEGGGVYLLSHTRLLPGRRSSTRSSRATPHSRAPDLFGTVDQDQGYNLIGDGEGASGFTAASDQVGTTANPIDPMLAPLGDYGGPTQTMALLHGSPAIGRGTTVAGLTADQRGFALDSPRPDIGAFQSNPLVVNTTSDGPGSPPGILSLRLAVKLANVTDGAATITFDSTVFAAPQTIALTTGQLELSDAGGLLTIDGPAAGLTIDAGGKSRVFQVDSGVTAALSGLTLTGGSAGFGGGLVNLDTITLTNCTISGNSASIDLGGGLWNGGTATLVDCTINGNSAGEGGGLSNDGTATLTDCTLSGNTAKFGGGLETKGAATITDCTISGNSASENGGGVYLPNVPNARTTLVDTIVAGNAAITSPDVSGTVTDDRGDNLIGDGDGAGGFTAAGDQVGTSASRIDPRLAPLGDYGGPTQTMALRAGSPAIGKGVAIPAIATDQRGFALDSPNPDIGAFQSDPLVVNTTSDGAGSLRRRPRPSAGRQPGQRDRHRRDDHRRPDGLRGPSDDRSDGRPARAERSGWASDDRRPGGGTDCIPMPAE